jgi:hypothetical protein
MKSTIQLDAYRQVTTTTYDRRNLSIIDSQLIGKPLRLPLFAKQYMEIFEKSMVPKSTASAIDNSTVATLAFNLAWMHRTFTEVFPDNTGTIGASLENLLAIPLQLSVIAYQYANYTDVQLPLSNAWVIPESMITVAYGGRSVQRLAVQPGTGWSFIVMQIVILLFVLINIMWIMWAPRICDNYAHLPELDTLARARTITCYKDGGPPVQQSASNDENSDGGSPAQQSAPNDENSDEASSPLGKLALETQSMSLWQGAKQIRGWRFKVAAAAS